MATGAGTSGSTAWSNSVRSRLYFQGAKASDGSEPDKNLRVLEAKKSNYGPANLWLTLEWKNGLFVPVHGSTGLDRMAIEAKAERVFLELLAALTAQGRDVSPNQSSAHAPCVFEKHPSAEGVTRKQFAAAMERLLASDRIRIETIGPPSRRYKRLTIAPPKEEI
jgi:RecA-family ATPase